MAIFRNSSEPESHDISQYSAYTSLSDSTRREVNSRYESVYLANQCMGVKIAQGMAFEAAKQMCESLEERVFDSESRACTKCSGTGCGRCHGKTVKLMGHEVRVGSKKHQILTQQKRNFDDAASSERHVSEGEAQKFQAANDALVGITEKGGIEEKEAIDKASYMSKADHLAAANSHRKASFDHKQDSPACKKHLRQAEFHAKLAKNSVTEAEADPETDNGSYPIQRTNKALKDATGMKLGEDERDHKTEGTPKYQQSIKRLGINYGNATFKPETKMWHHTDRHPCFSGKEPIKHKEMGEVQRRVVDQGEHLYGLKRESVDPMIDAVAQYLSRRHEDAGTGQVILEGAAEHEALKDHKKNPFHKVLHEHGFIHVKTDHRQNRFSKDPKHDYTEHRYEHPKHGKSHVTVTQEHRKGANETGNSYVHWHEQDNKIMAPSKGVTKGQLHRDLSAEYGVPHGMTPPKPTAHEKKYPTWATQYKQNAEND